MVIRPTAAMESRIGTGHPAAGYQARTGQPARLKDFIENRQHWFFVSRADSVRNIQVIHCYANPGRPEIAGLLYHCIADTLPPRDREVGCGATVARTTGRNFRFFVATVGRTAWVTDQRRQRPPFQPLARSYDAPPNAFAPPDSSAPWTEAYYLERPACAESSLVCPPDPLLPCRPKARPGEAACRHRPKNRSPDSRSRRSADRVLPPAPAVIARRIGNKAQCFVARSGNELRRILMAGLTRTRCVAATGNRFRHLRGSGL